MEYKFTILSFLLTIFATTQPFAQEMLSCDLTTENGQGVDVQLFALSETPIGNGDCTYDFQAIVSTDDGQPATEETQVELTLTPSGSQPIVKIVTLEIGQISVSEPMTPATVVFPCGQAGTAEVQILGSANADASCADAIMLPVELSAFSAIMTDDAQIKLVWETLSEMENKGFEIQRSVDGYKWEILTFIKGAGTTLQKQNYLWMDIKPFNQQTSYYRLKQVDYDNSYAYSPVVSVKPFNDDKMTAYPNPVSNWLSITLEEFNSDVRFDIYNVQGRLIKSIDVKTESNTVRVNTSELESGIYWLIASTGQVRNQVRFVKQ